MKRERGFGRCGLACCLCSEDCAGCAACPGKDACENRRCSLEKGLSGCWECAEVDCRKGLLAKIKPRVFTDFLRRFGAEELRRCLERNEACGVVYHRVGVRGDYDDFTSDAELTEFIRTGRRA